MSYWYNDPSGYAGWAVNEGETPEQAKSRLDAMQSPGSSTLSSSLAATLASPGGGTRPIDFMSSLYPPSLMSTDQARSIWPTNDRQIAFGRPGSTEQRRSASDYQNIDQLTRTGWLPAGYSKAVNFRGGQMFYNTETGQWDPLNVVLGGPLTGEQSAAMPDFLRMLQSQLPSTDSSQYPVTGSGITGNMDWQDILAKLMNRAETIGNAGAQQFAGLNETLNKFLEFTQSNAASQADRQKEIADMLLGKVMPGVESAIAGMNEGFSPQGRAALDTLAFERLPQMFDRQQQDIRTQLARRGAIGGTLPGSAGDIVRELGGLESEKERTISNLLSQNVIANEQQLSQNRDRGLSAVGLANALMGTTGGIFSPNAYLGQSGNTLQTILSAIGGQNAAQLGGLGIEANLGGALAGNQPENLMTLLLSTLLKTAGGDNGWLDTIMGLFKTK